jgi:iron(III) transport system ATP-binding protein
MAVSDRIIVMNRATIAQEGAPRELYEEPRDPFVAGFMGDANRARGILVRRDGAFGDVTLGPLALSLPHRGLPDGDVELSIRPESIALRAAGATPLAATVRKAAYLGGVIEYTLDTGIGALFAVATAVEHPFAVGENVSIELARHGVVLIPPGKPDECH